MGKGVRQVGVSHYYASIDAKIEFQNLTFVSIQEFAGTLNEWGKQQIPFLCLVDFEMEKPLAFRLDEVNPEKILYEVNGVSNAKGTGTGNRKYT